MARPSAIERFHSRITAGENGCHDWTGTMAREYGVISKDGRTVYAHRLAWEIANGPIPPGLVIDHICGNAKCVNPSHLRAVTQKQNTEHRTKVAAASGYRGVYWEKKIQKWRVRVKAEGYTFNRGPYDDIEEANRVAIAIRNEVFTHNDRDRVA